MRKHLHHIVLCIFIAGLLSCGCGEFARKTETLLQLKDGYDPNALVLLAHIDHRQNETLLSWPRVAFAVGDGTILLTAKHCVDRPPRWPERPMSPEIVAISPYYGDMYHCELLAAEKKTDLAILKASWPIHPALALADAEELRAAETLTVFSRPVRKSKQPHRLGRQIRTTTLDVEQLNITKPMTGMKLKGTGPIRRGWSGSPIVLPESAKVTGVISALSGIRLNLPILFSITFIFDTVGTNVESIWELLEQHHLQLLAKSYYPADFEPVAKARPAFSGLMDHFEVLFRKESTESMQTAEKLVSLRPESSNIHRLVAMIAYAQAQQPDSDPQALLELAESSYRKAVRLDPNSASLRAAYGNFLLNRRRYHQALTETQAALAGDPNNELATINRLILLTQTEPNRAEEYAAALIAKDPNNPDYWFYRANTLLELGKKEQAFDAAQKAVELDPKGGYYGGLADILVELGRLDEAERHYRKMTKSCGCQRCWYKYARFLVRHRPKKLKQADKALKQAEAKAYMLRVPREDMYSLRRELRKKNRR